MNYKVKYMKLSSKEEISKVVFQQNDDRLNIVFGDYTLSNIDISKACCETYCIYVNSSPFDINSARRTQAIRPSDTIEITFGMKQYKHTKNSYIQKNYMLVKFSGGDRIRVVRDHQYCIDSHRHIFTRSVFLKDKSKGMGMDKECIGIV